MKDHAHTILSSIDNLKCIESILVDITPATVANDIAITRITEFLKECNKELEVLTKIEIEEEI